MEICSKCGYKNSITLDDLKPGGVKEGGRIVAVVPSYYCRRCESLEEVKNLRVPDWKMKELRGYLNDYLRRQPLTFLSNDNECF